MSQIIKESRFVNSEGKRWEDYDTILCPDGEVIDMQQLLDDQSRASASLIHLQPFFGAFIGKLTPVYTFQVKTQAVDGTHLFINPQFTAHLNLTEKCFVMAHEIMHCVLNHLRRMKDNNLDHDKANIAGDYECNITLAKVPDGMGLFSIDTMKKIRAYVDEKYSNWGIEAIYKVLPDRMKETMDNSGQSSNASKSQDFADGWNQAMKDYKDGKLKI